MSKTIDERVVSMQFDNKQFENNVKTSMSTLAKLKQSLNLTDSAKGLENIGSAAKKIDMNPLANGLETVRVKFSALEVMAVTALANITNSAVNAGKRIVSALTIDPIKTGFQEYETQINAVQTILANTSSKGTNLDQVSAALDELNHYADMTIYNFTEMTRNIGTFTAAGVDLNTSVSAIKGIANLAAVSGSNSQQASAAMYQLSQALASGTVKLMDWNSVVNAGMGGQVFQDALKETARIHGIAIDNMIESEGSFRETLQNGWLTSDILTETLSKFTGDLNEDQLRTMGYTEDQIASIIKMGQTANDAATKVKTFTQLFDTLKEAAQSGWTQSWEIIVGDFEEAKELLSEMSDVFSGLINSSAEARNNLLQGWKDLGGRSSLIQAARNAFEGIISIAKPIKEAFRDIFPPITAQQLYNITKGLESLTAKLKLSDLQSAKLKSTLKGLFSVVDIFATAIGKVVGGVVKLIGHFTGLGDGVLNITGSLGDLLSKFRDNIKQSDLFGKSVNKVVGFLGNAIDKVKAFGTSIKESFTGAGVDGVSEFAKAISDIAKTIGSGIVTAISSIGTGIAKAFGGTDFFDVLNNGLLAGILVYIGKFIKKLTCTFDDGVGVLKNVKGILDDVRGCFKAYQDQLKAGTLLKIAAAIGILAAAIFVISTIDANSLSQALGAITVLFLELVAALGVVGKMNSSVLNLSGLVSSLARIAQTIQMVGLATAVLILAGSMKILANLDWNGIAKGLVGIAGMVTILVVAAKVMDNEYKTITKFAGQMTVISIAVGILAGVAKLLATMSWDGLGKAGAGMFGIITILVSAAKIMDSSSATITKFAGQMIIMSVAVGILAGVAKVVESMSWEGLGKAGAGIFGLVTMFVAVAKIMDSSSASITRFGGQMLLMSTAIAILVPALKSLSSMSLPEIGIGLLAMGGALAELAIGLHFMNGTLAGSSALLVAVAALIMLTPVLKTLGSMSTGSIAKSLLTLAGAFTVIGVAGLLLAPLIPALLGLAGAFALFGISMVGIGAGLTLVGIGLTSVATAGVAAAVALVAAINVIISGILDLIPTIVGKISNAIVAFCDAIATCAPIIANTFLQVLLEVLSALLTYEPQIVSTFMTLLINVMNSIADHLPELIKAAVNLIGKFLEGIIAALNEIDTTNLLKGIIAVGLLTTLMFALSAVVGAIPGAMVGVLGVGVVVAELAIVLAAIGALAQIPGLEWLIGEGGNLLEKVGTAIGKFVGGIAGGFASGMSSSLPEIADNLSAFMQNIQPFIDGAKSIDASITDGISSLAKAILILTATDLLSGIASFVTGGSSLSDFAKQLVPFGNSMKEYGDSISGMNSSVVEASASAAQALAELASNLPSVGGLLSLFTGDNSLATFAEQLIPFGKAMKKYSDSVEGISSESIESSVNAAKALSDLGNNLQNSGGLVSLFTGDNTLSGFAEQLVPFGKAMNDYATAVSGLEVGDVTNSVTAASALSNLANRIQNNGGLVSLFTGDGGLGSLGPHLLPFGRAMKQYADSVVDLDVGAVTNSVTATSALSNVANNIQNGGLLSLFTDDGNIAFLGAQLVPFGTSLKQYSDSVIGVDVGAIASSASGAWQLVNVIKGMTDLNASGVNAFTQSLNALGTTSVDGFVNAFTNAGGRASSAISSMIFAAQNAVNAQSGSFTNMFNLMMVSSLAAIINTQGQFTSAGSTLMNGLRAGVMSGSTSLVPIITSFMTAMYVTITSRQEQFTSAGNQLMSKFSSGILDGSRGVTSTITATLGSCVSTIRGYYEGFYSAGSYVTSGFANGISGSSYEAATAARAMANAAKTAAAKALDERSPSKVFEQIGKYVPMGFANGVMKLAGLASESTSVMAKMTIDNTTKALSKIGEIASGNIDIQPRISPVVDMSSVRVSNIQLGADLNTVFNDSITTISQIMTETQAGIDASNKEVVDAVNGLRSDLVELYSADEQEVALYVDSKKMASTLAKPMNRQLNILSKRGAY